MSCKFCPRQCVKHNDRGGFCNTDSSVPEAAAVYVHHGEEPPISGQRGISNIFFAHCNLQCVFCQNYEISRQHVGSELIHLRGIDAIVEAAAESLQHTENMLGLVSATQYADSIPVIVEKLHKRGLYPTVVYNSNGYDSIETLKAIAPFIDVYLPDLKYADSRLAERYSNAADYPLRATEALKEMYSQKGSALPIGDDGLAFRGIIIRHLVLPGQVDNSLQCLRWIADNLSTNIHVSLMSQYFPPDAGSLPDQLNRRLTDEEYSVVCDEFYRLGFHNGWTQMPESSDNYKPHFANSTIFK